MTGMQTLGRFTRSSPSSRTPLRRQRRHLRWKGPDPRSGGRAERTNRTKSSRGSKARLRRGARRWARLGFGVSTQGGGSPPALATCARRPRGGRDFWPKGPNSES
jgi:hypothetical protein